MTKKINRIISIVLIFLFVEFYFPQSQNAYAATSNDYASTRINPEIVGSKIRDLYNSGKYTNNLILKDKPIVNGVQYYTIELRNLKLDNNYNLISSSGVNKIFVDSNWKLVDDPSVIEKLLVIWKANILYDIYYKDIHPNNNINKKGNFLVTACEENKENRDNYIALKAVSDACAEASSILITGGTKAATKELLAKATKDILSDPEKLVNAYAQIYISSLLSEYEKYARGLDEFYWNLEKKKQVEIIDYNDACNYIDLTYKAANITNLITLQMDVDGRSDASTDMASYIKDYFMDVVKGAITLTTETDGNWIKVNLSDYIDVVEEIQKYIEDGDSMKTLESFAKISKSFENFLTAKNKLDQLQQKEKVSNYSESYNYQLLNQADFSAEEAKQLILKEDSKYVRDYVLITDGKEESIEDVAAIGYGISWDLPKEDGYAFSLQENGMELCGYFVGKQSKNIYCIPHEGGYCVYQIQNNKIIKTFKWTGQGKSYEWRDNGDGQIVTFVDKNLERAIRNEISKYRCNIYKSDVEKITELNLLDKGIKDIRGIENLSNLNKLILSNNDIIDISPLSKLVNLRYLDIGNIGHGYENNNDIRDLTPLESLTNLEVLNAYCLWELQDIKPLSSLKNLKELSLTGDVKLRNMESISNLKSLVKLSLSYDLIEDINPLKSLTNLKDLDLYRASIDKNKLKELKDSLPSCTIHDDEILSKNDYLRLYNWAI